MQVGDVRIVVSRDEEMGGHLGAGECPNRGDRRSRVIQHLGVEQVAIHNPLVRTVQQRPQLRQVLDRAGGIAKMDVGENAGDSHDRPEATAPPGACNSNSPGVSFDFRTHPLPVEAEGLGVRLRPFAQPRGNLL